MAQIALSDCCSLRFVGDLWAAIRPRRVLSATVQCVSPSDVSRHSRHADGPDTYVLVSFDERLQVGQRRERQLRLFGLSSLRGASVLPGFAGLAEGQGQGQGQGQAVAVAEAVGREHRRREEHRGGRRQHRGGRRQAAGVGVLRERRAAAAALRGALGGGTRGQ